MFETERCLIWAGVKLEGDFQQAVTECTLAVELHTADKLEEACQQMDQGIRLLDKVLRELGVYDEIRAPGQSGTVEEQVTEITEHKRGRPRPNAAVRSGNSRDVVEQETMLFRRGCRWTPARIRILHLAAYAPNLPGDNT